MDRIFHYALVFSTVVLSSCGIDQSKESRLLDDVNPTGDTGSIEIQVPTGVDLKDYSFFLHKPGEGQELSNSVTGKRYNLADGEYCLLIRSSFHHIERCQYVVEKNKLTTVKLGIVSPIWNPSDSQVQMGPRAKFTLSQENTNSIFFPKLMLERNDAIGYKFLYPSGNIKVSYFGVEALSKVSKSITVTEMSSVNFDVTPPELRIPIVITTEKNKYLIPKVEYAEYISSYGILAYSGPKNRDPYRVPRDFSTKSGDIDRGTYGEDLEFQWAKVPLYENDKSVSMRWMAYPLSPAEGSYSITVSGVSKFFTLSDLKSANFELEPVNVSNINGTTPGFFKYFLIDDGNIEMPIGVDRIFARMSSKFSSFWFPTNSTLYVLRGFRYRMDTYLKDAAGSYLKQSTHELDYRQ